MEAGEIQMAEIRGSDALPWLHLLRITGGGAVLRRLIDAYSEPLAVLSAPRSELLTYFGGEQSSIDALRLEPSPDDFATELDWLESPRNRLLSQTEPEYPPLLREIASAPPLLFVCGDVESLRQPQLAIVGSRNPTMAGCENARAFSEALVRAGLVVTSGLALGIDACSHEATLAAGGSTVAVAATGLDRVYPAAHRNLAHAISAQGALVSEFPLGTPPRREHFPRRNRLISGLSLGVLVVEAAVRSGSLITARYAGEQGREVFAIPGSIHSPLARGCHALIRQGAKLVESAQDILEELGPLAQSSREMFTRKPVRQQPESTAAAEFLEVLGFDPVDIDTLINRTGLTAGAVSSMLLAMELQGLVESRPGGKFQRTS